jgi:hypothetical protein
MIRDKESSLPSWIGVKKGWQLHTDDPRSCLIELRPEHLRTHALVVGSTGSGKTTLLHHLIAQDLQCGHSICVLDMRGDLTDAVLQMCARRVPVDRVKFLDLRERERPLGFDPLSGSGEPYFKSLALLDALARESDSWGVQLAETLRYALMLLAECGAPLTELESLFYNRSLRHVLLSHVGPSPMADFWERFDALSSDRQQALAGPVANKVSILFATKTLRTVLGHREPLDLEDQVNTRGTVTLVSLAVDELHQAGRITGNLFLSSLCREVFARVSISESLRVPLRLYVDEFEHFISHDFEAILAEGRRFGLSLVLAHQTLSQLTPRMRSMVLHNVGVKVAFRCGRDDAKTLSADITGDAKAVDLHDLATGEALVWVRGYGWDLVEMNEPIIGGGRSDAATSAYRDELRFRNGDPADEIIEAEIVPEEPEEPRRRSTQQAPVKQNLEDWLCG